MHLYTSVVVELYGLKSTWKAAKWNGIKHATVSPATAGSE